MGLAPTYRTARLVLRPLATTDEGALVAEINHLAISKWLAVVPFPYGHADFQFFLTEIAKPREAFVVADDRGLAGVVSLQDHILGYWLALRAQGLGYATEAAGCLLEAHFNESSRPIQSGYFEGSRPSANVLAKLGFVETGRDIKHCRAQGIDLPHVLIELTQEAFVATA